MKKIQMVDLKGQYDKIKEEVDSRIQAVIDTTTFINGPEVSEFAADLAAYMGVKHVIPCANGTDALQIAMMALDLRPGDEVITANFTYVATAEVLALLQLTPVLVDVDPDTFNIDPVAIRKAITPKTKAIVPVHLFGQSAPMEEVNAIAEEFNLFVIEDTAQAIGADYRFEDGSTQKAGTIGHIGATSFFPSKNLGCYGDGGALFTNNDAYANRIRMIANHGQSKRYYHDSIGVNSRLDSIQAAVLSVKLKHLDAYSAARKKVADFYDAAFANVAELITPNRYAKSTHVFHQYTLKTSGIDRFDMQEKLAAEGVPCMIYYPVPLHMQKAYEDERYKKGDFPVTEELCERVISLPMQTELDEEQLQHIVKTVINYVSH
jgi:UDP-2-acetamido-2-deoxy-ribo-hexuluronate aminotransferase